MGRQSFLQEDLSSLRDRGEIEENKLIVVEREPQGRTIQSREVRKTHDPTKFSLSSSGRCTLPVDGHCRLQLAEGTVSERAEAT